MNWRIWGIRVASLNSRGRDVNKSTIALTSSTGWTNVTRLLHESLRKKASIFERNNRVFVSLFQNTGDKVSKKHYSPLDTKQYYQTDPTLLKKKSRVQSGKERKDYRGRKAFTNWWWPLTNTGQLAKARQLFTQFNTDLFNRCAYFVFYTYVVTTLFWLSNTRPFTSLNLLYRVLNKATTFHFFLMTLVEQNTDNGTHVYAWLNV